MASLGSLVTNVVANVAPFQKGMRQAQGSMKATQKAMSGLRTAAGALGVTFGAAGVAAFLKSSISAFDEQAKATADLEQALLSTGHAARLTLGDIQAFADARQKITLFGDEVTEKAAAILATFTNVRENAFKRTLAVAQDMATRLRSDLNPMIELLGKALNDPVKALSSLGRRGVQFNAAQEAMIKKLAESNRLFEAQGLILDELERQFGGAAEAAAKAGTGPIQQLENAVGDLKEALGGPIAGMLAESASEINKILDRLGIGVVSAADTKGRSMTALRQESQIKRETAAMLGEAYNESRFLAMTGPAVATAIKIYQKVLESHVAALDKEVDERIRISGKSDEAPRQSNIVTAAVDELAQASAEQVRLNRRQVELQEQELAIVKFQQDGTW